MSSKRSIDKQSSRFSVKSRRSSSGTVKQLSFQSTTKQDGFAIANDIMQKILENTLDSIYERYLEKQTINFVVHCAHQALMKVLKIHFYLHNSSVRKFTCCGSDKCPEPSPPDSWALHQVPLSKNLTEEEKINSLSSIKLELEGRGGEIMVDEGFDLASLTSEGLAIDTRNMLDEIIDNLPDEEEVHTEKPESVVSAFTMVVEGLQDYNNFKMKPKLSRISVGESTILKLPKIDLPESGNSRRYQSFTDLSSGDDERLPPIRTDANYKCRAVSPREEKTTKPKKSL